MKNTKKVVSTLLATALISTTAFAAIPNGSLIMGDQSFDAELLNDVKYKSTIQQALANVGVFNYKNYLGTIKSSNGEDINPNTLPEVTHIDKDGNISKYEAGDGEEIVQKEKCETLLYKLAA